MSLGRIAIIAGVIGIIGIILASIVVVQESDIVENTLDKEIQSIVNETEYKPLPKEWQVSGPFQIDRSEYAIGEKIFIIGTGLWSTDKGQMVIMRPLNSTHYSIWDTIPFDGATKSEFKLYVEPKISKFDGICSVNDLTGKWLMIFNGTNYSEIDFDINKKIVPGTNIEPVC